MAHWKRQDCYRISLYTFHFYLVQLEPPREGRLIYRMQQFSLTVISPHKKSEGDHSDLLYTNLFFAINTSITKVRQPNYSYPKPFFFTFNCRFRKDRIALGVYALQFTPSVLATNTANTKESDQLNLNWSPPSLLSSSHVPETLRGPFTRSLRPLNRSVGVDADPNYWLEWMS